MTAVSHLVVTDLDGTLLNHRNYDYAEALPALERLSSLGIPVVFCSSKTRLEMSFLQKEMGISAPMISENGGGIFFPSEQWPQEAVVLGTSYGELVRFFRQQRERYRFEARSFEDLSVDEISDLTGLDPKDAARARERDFSLPFLLPEETPPLVDRLEAACMRKGLRLTRGGRFFHLTGNNDKGRAVERLLEIYRKRFGSKPTTLGLGDSRNDLEMLRMVDLPVRIPNPGSSAPLANEVKWCYPVEQPAPGGWSEAVEAWLHDLKRDGAEYQETRTGRIQ